MKKTLILLALAVTAVLALAGCTVQIGKIESGTAAGGDNTQTAAQTTISITAALTTAEDVSGEIPRGVWSGDVYTNTFADLSFSLPSGWMVYTDGQLAELMGATASEMLGENFSPEILALTTIYDMMAVNNSGGSNVMVMYENLEAEGAEDYTLAQYIDSLVYQLSTYGYYTDFGETFEADLCGNTYTVLPLEASSYNLQQYYYIRRNGNYMIAVLISSVNDDASLIAAYFN